VLSGVIVSGNLLQIWMHMCNRQTDDSVFICLCS